MMTRHHFKGGRYLLNQVQLIGNLGADPEVRTVNDTKVANLRVACSEKWKDKNTGERKEKTEWINVTLWGPLAGIAEQYLKKGSKAYFQGKFQTRKWQDQSGQDRYSSEVVVQGFGGQMIMLDSPGSSSGGSYGGGTTVGSGSQSNVDEAEIPF